MSYLAAVSDTGYWIINSVLFAVLAAAVVATVVGAFRSGRR